MCNKFIKNDNLIFNKFNNKLRTYINKYQIR